MIDAQTEKLGLGFFLRCRPFLLKSPKRPVDNGAGNLARRDVFVGRQVDHRPLRRLSMAVNASTSPPQSTEPATQPAVTETRFDAAHQFAGRVESSATSSAKVTEEAASGDDEPALPDAPSASIDFVQLRNHARQIAALLRVRKEELDHREAELTRQLSEYDKDLRQARLWTDEQRQELTDREEAIQRREQTIERRLTLLLRLDDPAEFQPPADDDEPPGDPKLLALAELFRHWYAERQALNAGREDLRLQREELSDERRRLEQDITNQRETALRSVHAALEHVEKRRETLDQREQSLQAAELEWTRRRGEPHPIQVELAAKLDLHEAALDQREQMLEASERQLSDAAIQWENHRAEMLAERQRLEGQARLDRQRLADEMRQKEAELAEKRAIVERESEEVDTRRTALEHEHEELMRLHRETLELRLANEELATHLGESIPSAKLTQALGQSRQRLAEQFRLESSAIQRRREELDQLRESLDDQIEQLASRSEQLQTWIAARQEDLQRQASTLVSREQQLEAQAVEHRNQQQQWQHERMQLEQDVRRLQGELRVLRLRERNSE